MAIELDVDPGTHRKLAVGLYNGLWPLLEKDSRTADDNDEMERASFASLYHWSKVGDATNIAIGEWMISHVYVSLGRIEDAIRFAQRTIDTCERNGLSDFYLAYGFLEMARALRVAGRHDHAKQYLDWAREVEIAADDDREIFRKDLETDHWGPALIES